MLGYLHVPLILLFGVAFTTALTPLTKANLPEHLTQDGLKGYMALSDAQQDAVIKKLAHFGVADAPSLRFSPSGRFYLVDPAPSAEVLANKVHHRRAVSDLPLTDVDSQGLPQLSSKPGARNKLYLDFNGHRTNRKSPWKAFTAGAFSLDNDASKFNRAEQLVIYEIWQRVTEDFSPFQYDVTTIQPTSFNKYTSHALITKSRQTNGRWMPDGDSSSGVAYVDIFGDDDNVKYSPALIFSDASNNRPDFIAETVSHEIGHNLGLSHDGRDFPGTSKDEEYFGGNPDPNNPVSWAPIMGFSDLSSITQWSKGEYAKASNKEDDVAILGRKLSVELDEAGDTIATAALLSLVSNKGKVTGIIATQQDKDVYEVTVSSAGTLTVDAQPWMADQYTQGNNLDLELTVLNSRNQRLTRVSPAKSQSCQASVALPAAGKYYLALTGVGAPGAYSQYGSLGQYDMEVTFAAGDDEPTTTKTTTATTTTEDDSNDEESSTTATSTTWYGEECLCAGATLNTKRRERSVSIRFDRGCANGHTFHLCLDRLDNSNAMVELSLYRRSGSSWSKVSSLPRLAASDGYMCTSYTVDEVSRNARFQLRINNQQRGRVLLTYGRRRYNKASQCVSE